MSAAAAPFVLILGMHRSGTSCLAGALELCGLFLGEVRRTGRHNPKGYFEPAELVRLHDHVLALNGGAWHRPPPRAEVHPVLRARLRAFAELLSARRPCGLKDPRLLVIDEWAEIPDAPVRSVGTFRHPLAVAASLEARNGLPVETGLALWLDYNQRLIERHRRAPFPLIAYDLSQPDRYRRAIAEIAGELGLRVPRWRLRRFVTRRLDHHPAATEIPAACAEAYRYLLDHSLQAREAT
jgi:hypothetical protein